MLLLQLTCTLLISSGDSDSCRSPRLIKSLCLSFPYHEMGKILWNFWKSKYAHEKLIDPSCARSAMMRRACPIPINIDSFLLLSYNIGHSSIIRPTEQNSLWAQIMRCYIDSSLFMCQPECDTSRGGGKPPLFRGGYPNLGFRILHSKFTMDAPTLCVSQISGVSSLTFKGKIRKPKLGW